MAVFITDTCINCRECVDACASEAIVDELDNPRGEEIHYVDPDRCFECGDQRVPDCGEICPVDGCIVWAEGNSRGLPAGKAVA